MKLCIATLAAFAMMAGMAEAASAPSVPWAKKDMVAAVKALAYPKAHARKVGCRGLGTPDGTGRYDSFRCTATYKRKPHRRVFYTAGQGEGGWLCAGKTPTGCKLLRRGFVPRSIVATQGIGATADLAARGYMSNRFGSYQATGFCKQSDATHWSCGFATGKVTLTVKAGKLGYVIAAMFA